MESGSRTFSSDDEFWTGAYRRADEINELIKGLPSELADAFVMGELDENAQLSYDDEFWTGAQRRADEINELIKGLPSELADAFVIDSLGEEEDDTVEASLTVEMDKTWAEMVGAWAGDIVPDETKLNAASPNTTSSRPTHRIVAIEDAHSRGTAAIWTDVRIAKEHSPRRVVRFFVILLILLLSEFLGLFVMVASSSLTMSRALALLSATGLPMVSLLGLLIAHYFHHDEPGQPQERMIEVGAQPVTAVLRGADDLRGANLVDADLHGDDLTDADLTAADLTGADLTAADLRGADLTAADLAGALLVSALLTAANLRGANLRGANLRDANLRGADLTGADLTGADLTDATLTDARWRTDRKPVLPKSYAPTLVPHGDYVSVGPDCVSVADLSGADLSGADLTAADLRGADLTAADLAGALLTAADLRGADLRGANLRGANLKRADLTGADLTGADLTDATLTDARWRIDRKPVLPKSYAPTLVPHGDYVSVGPDCISINS